jgi:DNA-binding LacI/PurR family transcriptional regulator
VTGIIVAGFDDIPLAAYFRPSLTTVRQPIAEVGVAIVDALSTQLAGQPALPVQLPAALVVRDSTG